MKDLDKYFFFIMSMLLSYSLQAPDVIYDCAIVGFIKFADGIGRQASSLVDVLGDSFKVKLIPSRLTAPLYKDDLSQKVVNAFEEKKRGKYKVAMFEDLLTCGPYELYKRVPPADIKFAYTMVESTVVCAQWVDILNNYFDAAIVPDEFLVNVYKRSGVTIPIFVVPLIIHHDEKIPVVYHPHRPFVFGFSGSFVHRKNHKALLEAFARVFDNNPDVKLVLHGRDGNETYQELQDYIQARGLRNVELIRSTLSWKEYQELFHSFDCYVSVSRGEGFSMTPWEALACGIPCIISDNTAHHTLCLTGFVYKVVSENTSPAYYRHLNGFFGDFFECDVHDVVYALQDVYDHYTEWLEKACKAQVWIRETSSVVQNQYCTLVRPKRVLLSTYDRVTEDEIITTSEKLLRKYQKVMAKE